ncbi:MAG: S1C family serine protease [Chloroflexota bacterium]|nr:S1C family serine protease [Chloroflexota bacterium]
MPQNPDDLAVRRGRSVRVAALAGAAFLSLGLGAAGVLALDGDGPVPTASRFAAFQVTTPEAGTKECPERNGNREVGDAGPEVALLRAAAQDAGAATQPSDVSADLSVADVAEQTNPAVVTITSESEGFGAQQVPVGAGSGFIVDAEGRVVTNEHVVDGADELSVEFFDGTTVPATVVGRDEIQDIAVVQLDLSGGQEVPGTVAFGDSDAVRPGDRVVAIGSSLGEFTNTVSDGTVGAVGRELANFQNLIQHDAEIYPGNSGGPLLNLAGEVVGVNVAGVGGGDSPIDVAPARLGFALAANDVREVVDQLVATGEVVRPYLGIVGDPTDDGQVVVEVEGGTPAAEAGLEAGDVITAIDGQALDGQTSFLDLLLERAPGDTVALTIERDGAEQEIEVVLAERPADLQ